MPDIKLIALDLDGTLLDSRKTLSPANAASLLRAAQRGIHIVPTTGRFYGGMPAVIRELPYLRYVIGVNGAEVRDILSGEVIYRAEMPVETAVSIMSYLDTLPVLYDCYQENGAFITRSMKENCEEFMPNEHTLRMMRELREPVPELKAFLLERGRPVQKVQLFAKDMSLRERLLETLESRFPDIAVSTAIVNNVEINDRAANKGAALSALAAHLGINMENVMSFGDGTNDISMLRAAGYGFAMANASERVKASANYLTASCDEDGVSQAIEAYCFG